MVLVGGRRATQILMTLELVRRIVNISSPFAFAEDYNLERDDTTSATRHQPGVVTRKPSAPKERQIPEFMSRIKTRHTNTESLFLQRRRHDTSHHHRFSMRSMCALCSMCICGDKNGALLHEWHSAIRMRRAP